MGMRWILLVTLGERWVVERQCAVVNIGSLELSGSQVAADFEKCLTKLNLPHGRPNSGCKAQKGVCDPLKAAPQRLVGRGAVSLPSTSPDYRLRGVPGNGWRPQMRTGVKWEGRQGPDDFVDLVIASLAGVGELKLPRDHLRFR